MVLKELGSPDTKAAVKKYLAGVVTDGAKEYLQRCAGYEVVFPSIPLKQHRCARCGCLQTDSGETYQREADDNIGGWYLTALGASALAFLLLMAGKKMLYWFDVVVLLLFCVTLLAGGIFSPMLEVEAKISQLTFTFFGQPLSFPEQVLYYQSRECARGFQELSSRSASRRCGLSGCWC